MISQYVCLNLLLLRLSCGLFDWVNKMESPINQLQNENMELRDNVDKLLDANEILEVIDPLLNRVAKQN